MKPILRFLICIVLLGVVGTRPVTAEDANIADCFSADIELTARAVACRAAAEQGDAKVQYNLGVMYATGRGVPQDDAEAAKWYRRAAEQGYASAQHNLGIMYANGKGVPQDYTLAHMWFNLAGVSGDKKAAENRNRVAKNMTPAQVAEAQRLAREWTAAHRAEAKSE